MDVEISSALIDKTATTRLHVDLAAVASNVAAIRQLLEPSTRIMAMVKARSYGTSPDFDLALFLQPIVDFLGVATVDEGTALRELGVTLPILVMLATPDEVDKLIGYQLTPAVYTEEILDAVLQQAVQSSTPVTVHLEVDSGMHRTGFSPERAALALMRIRDAGNVHLEGLMTHLGCADDPNDDDYTRMQFRRFDEVCETAKQLGFADLICHAAPTAATIRFPKARLDMVRIGIGLYGIYPSEATRAGIEFTPAVSLVTRLVEINEIEPGERVGYGGTFTAIRQTHVGTVQCGYDDGLSRTFSNNGYVIVSGKHCPIIGRLSMDSMTVDLTDVSISDVNVGDDVLIFGRHNDWEIPINQVAETGGTIPWELLTQIGSRVQRVLR